MKKIQTEVLVIGGGATGTGILRDLAMRGFKVVLVEQRDLTHGTTGRYHGLLHSGGRYAVKDPQAARECIAENMILRRVMPQCIEDTGGFFVVTPWDDPAYVPQFLAGCEQAGIPVDDVPIPQMLKEEPHLNPNITHCFRVPDGAADSFLTADLNVVSAHEYGGTCLTYHPVQHLLVDQENGHKRIVGAICNDLIKDEEVQITADLVINAAGAWVGKITSSAGISVQILPGKGTMVAVNHRIVNTVINRCKMPSDGDILVPAHTVAVMGTTDIKVADPDHFGIEPWEIHLMLEEGEKIIPGFRELRLVRSWAGVRPLFQETVTAQNRDITRAFVLLDHAERDGVDGMLTITSGKWTTYRKMAEVTVDKACQILGNQRPCRTHLEELPKPAGHQKQSYHHIGDRLKLIEQQTDYGQLVCECELVTRTDVERAIKIGEAKTIDDIRRDVRLGMGPCQGGFCTYRTAGLLHLLRQPPVEETNGALCDFLKERWKGLTPILWGQQLQQERLNELIYLNVINADHLPGLRFTKLAAEPYETSDTPEPVLIAIPASQVHSKTTDSIAVPALDVLVIGAGLSGLVAGWQAAKAGKRTRVIAKGWGATHWASGCIDVFGYSKVYPAYPVTSPIDALNALISVDKSHPYAILGIDRIAQALNDFTELCTQSGYPMYGTLERNWLLPTALGTLRPTCLAAETMIAGDTGSPLPMLIVGFAGFQDFYADLIADNLNAQQLYANAITLEIPSLLSLRQVTGMTLARLFDSAKFRHEVANAIRDRLGRAARVGFPAVLGLTNPIEVLEDLERQLGLPVFEIPGLPPSIPGIRLHRLLVKAIQYSGGQVYDGMLVQAADVEDRVIKTIWSEAAARRKPHRSQKYILATGGFLGGGYTTQENGYAQDTVFNLPLSVPQLRSSWFSPDFLDPNGHSIFESGIQINDQLSPIDQDGISLLNNLSIVGSSLGSHDPIRERSLEGIALTTGFWAGRGL